MNKLFILLFSSLLILQGCQSNPAPTQPFGSNLDSHTYSDSSLTPEQPLTFEPEPAVYVAGEFNQESLYDLLLAEIAGQRKLFSVALDNYSIQAQKTRDPDVAKRATRIAQYLRNSDKTMSSANIWRDISPDNPEPYQIEATMLLHKGEYEAALPLINKALEYDPVRLLTLIRSHSDKINNTVTPDYIATLESYRHKNKTLADLALTLALLYRTTGQTERALKEFNNAALINPDNSEALIEKAELLRSENDLDGSLALIQSAFEKKPENKKLHVLYIRLLFETKQRGKATQEAEKLLNANIKDHQLIYYLSLLLLEAEQLATAQNALEQLLVIDADDSSPHFYLGHIEQVKKNKHAALEHYTSVKNGPNILSALSRAVGLLNNASNKPQVQAILNNARTMIPTHHAQIFTIEAEWLNLHNYSDEALALLDDALTTNPEDTSLLYTRAMMIESIDFPQAEQDLRKILILEPDNTTAKNALGYTLLLHTERFEEAYKLIASALSAQPEDPAILDSMGWVLYKMGRIKEAITYLEKAHALYPDPEVSSHLIQAYWADGQQKKAQTLLKIVLKDNPDNPFLDEAMQAINAD